MTAADAQILIETDGPIGTLIFSNPRRMNALTLAMWKSIGAAIAELDSNPDVRVIILRGAGDQAFVAGADISEFADVRQDAESSRHYEEANAGGYRAIRGCSKPTIAMVAGPCLGGGVGIALACDLRIAAANSIFGIPAARLGLGYPPDCMVDLVSTIGASAAKDLFFTARRVQADEALRMGLVSQVVPVDELSARVRTLAQSIASNAPMTIRAAKAAIDRLAHDPSPESLVKAAALTDACYESIDYAEGRTAFLEKRPPVFIGR